MEGFKESYGIMRTALAKTKDSSVLGFAQIELNVSRSPWVKLVFLSPLSLQELRA